MKKTFRVYGAEGHRQRESFCQSRVNDFSRGGNVRILEIRNSDITGTNDYTELVIHRNTVKEIYTELEGQLGDGIFENSRYGNIEEVDYNE